MGGAVSLASGAHAEIRNSALRYNSAAVSGGGAVHAEGQAKLDVLNSTIEFNYAVR